MAVECDAIEIVRDELTKISANTTETPRYSADLARLAFERVVQGLNSSNEGYAFGYGQYVVKKRGYVFDGFVIMRGRLRGENKYVVESRANPGMLMIFTEHQLRLGAFHIDPVDQVTAELVQARRELEETREGRVNVALAKKLHSVYREADDPGNEARARLEETAWPKGVP